MADTGEAIEHWRAPDTGLSTLPQKLDEEDDLDRKTAENERQHQLQLISNQPLSVGDHAEFLDTLYDDDSGLYYPGVIDSINCDGIIFGRFGRHATWGKRGYAPATVRRLLTPVEYSLHRRHPRAKPFAQLKTAVRGDMVTLVEGRKRPIIVNDHACSKIEVLVKGKVKRVSYLKVQLLEKCQRKKPRQSLFTTQTSVRPEPVTAALKEFMPGLVSLKKKRTTTPTAHQMVPFSGLSSSARQQTSKCDATAANRTGTAPRCLFTDERQASGSWSGGDAEGSGEGTSTEDSSTEGSSTEGSGIRIFISREKKPRITFSTTSALDDTEVTGSIAADGGLADNDAVQPAPQSSEIDNLPLMQLGDVGTPHQQIAEIKQETLLQCKVEQMHNDTSEMGDLADMNVTDSAFTQSNVPIDQMSESDTEHATMAAYANRAEVNSEASVMACSGEQYNTDEQDFSSEMTAAVDPTELDHTYVMIDCGEPLLSSNYGDQEHQLEMTAAVDPTEMDHTYVMIDCSEPLLSFNYGEQEHLLENTLQLGGNDEVPVDDSLTEDTFPPVPEATTPAKCKRFASSADSIDSAMFSPAGSLRRVTPAKPNVISVPPITPSAVYILSNLELDMAAAAHHPMQSAAEDSMQSAAEKALMELEFCGSDEELDLRLSPSPSSCTTDVKGAYEETLTYGHDDPDDRRRIYHGPLPTPNTRIILFKGGNGCVVWFGQDVDFTAHMITRAAAHTRGCKTASAKLYAFVCTGLSMFTNFLPKPCLLGNKPTALRIRNSTSVEDLAYLQPSPFNKILYAAYTTLFHGNLMNLPSIKDATKTMIYKLNHKKRNELYYSSKKTKSK